MTILREVLLRISEKVTERVAVHWGERFPFFYVSEYPKSGGTWIAKVIADYLQIPFPQLSLSPVAMKCVIHNHWRFHPELKRVLYVVRDGRDVMVSLYFHRMRALRDPDARGSAFYKRLYLKVYGARFDPDDVRGNLPRFIEYEFAHPRDSRLTWAEHVDRWCSPEPRSGIARLRYEDMVTSPMVALRAALETLSLGPIDEWRLQVALDKFSFQRQAGRTPGNEDRSSFLRKGIVGDWRNAFSAHAAEVFDRLAGQQLVRLGYESDRSWVCKVPHR